MLSEEGTALEHFCSLSESDGILLSIAQQSYPRIWIAAGRLLKREASLPSKSILHTISGASKIPTVIHYDLEVNVKAVRAEATRNVYT